MSGWTPWVSASWSCWTPDTGHRATARRRQVGDYIELRETRGWPVDQRFYLQDGGFDVQAEADRLRRDGLDPAVALERRASGELLVWLFSYENNSTGGPLVGHAVVSRAGATEAVLDYVETSPGVPETVRLDLAYFACHSAAAAGIERVQTSLGDEVLSLAGFRIAPDGNRLLDTSFLAADPDGARALLAVDLSRQTDWGRDRDLAGRYLPTSRAGRALHRVRFGRSGGKPRMWAG